MVLESILEELQKHGIEYKTDYSLKNASTFRIGGECSLALFPDSRLKLIVCLALLRDADIKSYVLGKCSNTLFADGHLDIAAVFTTKMDAIKVDGTHIVCDAGASLAAVSNAACKAGLGGMEFASGIPASVGGAVFMNAGAYGGQMSDVVVESIALNKRSGQLMPLTRHGFGYRHSVYMKNKELVCIGATLKLEYADKAQIIERIKELAAQRREKQPLEYPSAGSYFKRPEGDFAARLIDVCGLKGTSVGGAEVSQKHAGFIINKGGATCADVLRLEEIVKDRVYEQTGIMLEREIEVIG
ncbi:MAG: UDP-N-acetylmuramate dehydrogenase [Ruminococcaceae bacterium]|nr:UDP-N-acetylmuramate dehydrogenase [Oscillospiraceae bacterium]